MCRAVSLNEEVWKPSNAEAHSCDSTTPVFDSYNTSPPRTTPGRHAASDMSAHVRQGDMHLTSVSTLRVVRVMQQVHVRGACRDKKKGRIVTVCLFSAPSVKESAEKWLSYKQM